MRYVKQFLIPFIIACTLICAGCINQTSADPIVGAWQDSLLGVSIMEFSGDNHYQGYVSNTSFSGTWNRMNDTMYKIDYTDAGSGQKYTNYIVYVPARQILYTQNKPDIEYHPISDLIVGNWVDTERGASLMNFTSDHGYFVQIGNLSFNGTWQKYNETHYLVNYTMADNVSSQYREFIVLNRSNDMIGFLSVPGVVYSRHFI